MITGFWGKLDKKCKKEKRPIFALAPMLDVTDFAFREIIAKYGKPDVLFTEFVSCDGICSKGKEKLLNHLAFTKKQKPIVAQFFGATPKNFRVAAKLAVDLGFDGIDINMGCPDRAVEKQGAGATLIKNPNLAKEIIFETKLGIELTGKKIPVSVKTRLGYNNDILEEWITNLFETEPAVITIHARTRKEMSKVEAHWDRISDAVKLRDAYFKSNQKTLIIGNGDVKTISDALIKFKQTGADGIMFGRGTFGNPFLFNYNKKEVSIKKRLHVMIEHALIFEKYFGNSNINRLSATKSFDVMKKHFKAYVCGFDGAKELRVELMKSKDVGEIKKNVERFLKYGKI